MTGTGPSTKLTMTKARLKIIVVIAVAVLVFCSPYNSGGLPSYPGSPLRNNSNSWPHLPPHEQLLQRLQGQSIHFIGDSVTRYQYNELVHYLETGTVPDAADPSTLIDGRLNPVNERTWDSWAQFYQGTTSYYTKGSATIDYFREPDTPIPQIIENRSYRNGNLELTYHCYTNHRGTCSVRGKSTWDFKATDGEPDWCFTLPGFVRNLVENGKLEKRGFTIALNGGLHGPMPIELFDEVYHIFTELEHDPGVVAPTAPKLIWKTTSPSLPGGAPDDSHLNLTMRSSANFQVMDTHAIFDRRFATQAREPLYWDNYHFNGPVYHAFNAALTDMVIASHSWTTRDSASPIAPPRGRATGAPKDRPAAILATSTTSLPQLPTARLHH
ncbi:hypothetical protein BDZ88DRAFT_430479 [Geranomyces variabilis]|nr:hypothetical protein BDZ88DRAFT_430479 [Geranomyces variabilis]KAJ3132659.1 hypothetical protein HDU90_006711 [Geranomyces variabilis]